MPLRFDIVYSYYLGLKKQFEDEAKERKKQEDEAEGKVNIPNVSSITNQAMSSMKNVSLPKYNLPSMGSISIPH